MSIHSLLYSLLIAKLVSDIIQIMNEENLSQTKKARAARKWRKQTSQRKRFEGTLKEFLKVKYNSIYDEYIEFYNVLNERYPNARELSKTPRFKKWARAIRREEQSSKSASEGRQSEDSGEVQPNLPNISCQDQTIPNQVDQQVSDVLSVALHDALSGVIPAQDEEVPFDDIENIINKLEHDNTIQAILDPFVDAILDERNEFDDIIHQPDNGLNPDDDEGIGLNLADEIDIKPFDYNLEVDF